MLRLDRVIWASGVGLDLVERPSVLGSGRIGRPLSLGSFRKNRVIGEDSVAFLRLAAMRGEALGLCADGTTERARCFEERCWTLSKTALGARLRGCLAHPSPRRLGARASRSASWRFRSFARRPACGHRCRRGGSAPQPLERRFG